MFKRFTRDYQSRKLFKKISKKLMVAALALALILTPFFDVTAQASTVDFGDGRHSIFAGQDAYYYGPGGRHDITLYDHSYTISMKLTLSDDVLIEYYDQNWNSIWSGSFSPTGVHTLNFGSNVYYVTIYLDNDKGASLIY